MSGVLVALAALVVLAGAPWWCGSSERARSVTQRRGRGAPVAGGRTGAGAGDRAGAGATGASARVPGGRSTRRRGGLRPPAGAVDGPPDAALLLDLVAAALSAGAPVPRALSTVADALPRDAGVPFRRAAAALALGSPWQAAWAGAPPAARAVADALEPTAAAGASPVPLLRTAAATARRRRRAAGRAAAGRVGVWLVLPLGLCFLPAFLLLGVVPVVLSLAGRLLG